MRETILLHGVQSVVVGSVEWINNESHSRYISVLCEGGSVIRLELFSNHPSWLKIAADPPDDEEDDFVDLGGEGHVHGSFDGMPIIVDKRIPSLKEGDIVIGRPGDPESVFPAAAAFFEEETDATRHDVRGAMS